MVDASFMSPAANGLANNWQTQTMQYPSVRAAASAQSTAAQIQDAENQLREQARRADREYGLKKRELDQQYQAAKLSAKTAKQRNEIDKWYNERQVEIAQQRLALDGQIHAERLAFDRESFAATHGLNQAKLGYDVLNMAANLRGPENYYQAANFARGAANDPNTAVFLGALKGNTRMPDFGAQYGVPDPETLSTLSSKLGTTLGQGAGTSIMPGTGVANGDNSLNQIRGLYAAGAHKLGAGSLEQLTDTELKLLQSGIDAVGGDNATFLDQYRRSRIGQSLGNARAA